VIVTGQTRTDESLLTGESAPRAKAAGDTVVSGNLNAGSFIRVRALRTSEDNALAQIIRLVERALSSRAKRTHSRSNLAHLRPSGCRSCVG
jgi:cation transport ATPase